MVNMYSMSMGYSNMAGSMNSGNVPQYFKGKYGQPQDFMVRPYVQPYPMGVSVRNTNPIIFKSWVARFIDKCFKG